LAALLAFPENQQSGTEAFADAVVAQTVVQQAFVDEVGTVVSQLAPLSVDDATAVVVTDEPDVLYAFGEDERVVVSGFEAVVVEGVGATYEHGAFHQLDGDVRLEVDAARQVAAHPKAERATALLGDPVDGVLDAACVHRYAVAADAEERGVVVLWFFLREGLEARDEEEGEDCSFHSVVVFGPYTALRLCRVNGV